MAAVRASTSNGYRHSYGSSNNNNNNNKRASQQSTSSGSAVPLITREEFEALPVAIQRKYFSTLERLRFAQGSGLVDGIYQHYDAISAQNAQRRRSRRQDRIVSDKGFTSRLGKRTSRESASAFTAATSATSTTAATGTTSDSSVFYGALPDKIKKRQFTREEQVLLAGQLRASVILDAADEAVYRLNRRRSAQQLASHMATTVASADGCSTPFPCPPDSMETAVEGSSSRRLRERSVSDVDGGAAAAAAAAAASSPSTANSVSDSFYDSFRWLDEDDDLDLRLFLDDYHANLRDQLPSSHRDGQPLQQPRRPPSFRRHLSISKLPFGKPTASSVGSRPTTTDAAAAAATAAASATSPTTASHRYSSTTPSFTLPSTAHSHAPTPSSSATSTLPHTRRKSRALSLITPRHAAQTSVSSAIIDPAAAHYQDPEARLKLRVYLASPQKFDEAIEFGFPSTEVLSSSLSSPMVGSSTVLPPPTKKRRDVRRQRRRNASDGSSAADSDDALRTFLADNDDEEDDDLDLLEHNNSTGTSNNRLDGSDQASVPDPESPRTPNLELGGTTTTTTTATGPGITALPNKSSAASGVFRPFRLSADPLPTPSSAAGHSRSATGTDGYPQVPISSREMTLRMTLTRLDLRAGEDQIYGWQQQQQQPQQYPFAHAQPHPQLQNHHSFHQRQTSFGGRKSRSPTPDEVLGGGGNRAAKESIEQVFAGIDHWEADAHDKSVMRRFWNRVRRS